MQIPGFAITNELIISPDTKSLNGATSNVRGLYLTVRRAERPLLSFIVLSKSSNMQAVVGVGVSYRAVCFLLHILASCSRACCTLSFLWEK